MREPDLSLEELINKFSQSIFFSVCKIPGSGLWLSREHMRKFGCYIKVRTDDIIWQAKHGEVPFLDKTNWARYSTQFVPHNSINEILVEKRAWLETTQFKTMCAQLRAGYTPYGCNSFDGISEHYHKLIENFQNVQQNGIKIQGYRTNNSIYPDDILVSLDKIGRILLERNGTHRLTLAKHYGFETITVFVIRIYPSSKNNEIIINNRILP
jgi:hypothetical protein